MNTKSDAATASPFAGFQSAAYVDGAETKPAESVPSAKEASQSAQVENEAEQDTAPQDDTPQDDAGDAAEAGDADGAASQDGEAPKPEPKKKTAQERIAELTRARREAERRAAAAEARAAAAEARAGRTPAAGAQDAGAEADGNEKDTLQPPDPDKFKYGEVDSDYLAALVSYNVEKTLRAERARAEKERQEEAAAQQARELNEKLDAQLAAGLEKYDDFEEKVIRGADAGAWPLTQESAVLIAVSDVGADIAYHLASNPSEAAALAAKPPLLQAQHIGHLEAKFLAQQSAQKPKTAPKPPITKAPAPVGQPRGAGGQFEVRPDTSDFAAFEAMVNRQQRK